MKKLIRMFLIFLALNAIYVFAFNDFDFMKNGNAEERFSFDGHFDRIEHGGYGHKSHKGTTGGSPSPCIIVEFYIVTLYSLVIVIKYSLDLLYEVP